MSHKDSAVPLKLGDHHGGSFRVYMEHKQAKLHDHFDRTYLSNSAPIFEGLCFYINGYTVPSFEELKLLIGKHGGRVDHYLTPQVNHVIATSLPQTKVNEFMKRKSFLPVTRPSWIVDSIRENRRLPVREYFLPNVQRAYGVNIGGMFRSLEKDVDFSRKRIVSSTGSLAPSGSDIESKESEAEVAIPCISSYYSASRLHHLGSWRRQLQAKMHPMAHQLKERERENNDIDANGASEGKISERGGTREQIPSAGRNKESHTPSSTDPMASAVAGTYIRAHGSPKEPKMAHSTAHTSSPGKISARSTSPHSGRAAKTSPCTSRASNSNKRIVHVDMDCFFVQVALLDYPQFRSCPVVVAQTNSKEILSSNTSAATPLSVHPSQSRAEISSASYEARASGVRRGMQVRTAYEHCPDLVMLPYNFEKTREISERFISALYQFSRIVEVVSVDEAYLDLSHSSDPEGDIRQLRDTIAQETKCVASVGLGPNKLIARLATDMAKPDGWRVLLPTPGKPISQQIRHLSVRQLPGVGYATRKKLEAMQIETIGQLQAAPLVELRKALGTATGKQLYDYAHGVDDRALVLYKERQSLSAEMNWGIRFKEETQAVTFLMELGREVERRLGAAAWEEQALKQAAEFHEQDPGVTNQGGLAAFRRTPKRQEGRDGNGVSGAENVPGTPNRAGVTANGKNDNIHGVGTTSPANRKLPQCPGTTGNINGHADVDVNVGLSPVQDEVNRMRTGIGSASSTPGRLATPTKTPTRTSPALVKIVTPKAHSDTGSRYPAMPTSKSNPNTPRMVKIGHPTPPPSATHARGTPSTSSPAASSSATSSPSNSDTPGTLPPLLLAKKMTLKLLIRVPGAPPPTKPMGVGLCTTHTFSTTFSYATSSGDVFGHEAVRLYKRFAPDVTQVRGIGISVHGLTLITSSDRAKGVDVTKIPGAGSGATVTGNMNLVDMFQQLSKEDKGNKKGTETEEVDSREKEAVQQEDNGPIEVDGDETMDVGVDSGENKGRENAVSVDTSKQVPKVHRFPFFPLSTSNKEPIASTAGSSATSTASNPLFNTSPVRHPVSRIRLDEIPELGHAKAPRITHFFKEKPSHTRFHTPSRTFSPAPHRAALALDASSESVELLGFVSPKTKTPGSPHRQDTDVSASVLEDAGDGEPTGSSHVRSSVDSQERSPVSVSVHAHPVDHTASQRVNGSPGTIGCSYTPDTASHEPGGASRRGLDTTPRSAGSKRHSPGDDIGDDGDGDGSDVVDVEYSQNDAPSTNRMKKRLRAADGSTERRKEEHIVDISSARMAESTNEANALVSDSPSLDTDARADTTRNSVDLQGSTMETSVDQDSISTTAAPATNESSVYPRNNTNMRSDSSDGLESTSVFTSEPHSGGNLDASIISIHSTYSLGQPSEEPIDVSATLDSITIVPKSETRTAVASPRRQLQTRLLPIPAVVYKTGSNTKDKKHSGGDQRGDIPSSPRSKQTNAEAYAPEGAHRRPLASLFVPPSHRNATAQVGSRVLNAKADVNSPNNNSRDHGVDNIGSAVGLDVLFRACPVATSLLDIQSKIKSISPASTAPSSTSHGIQTSRGTSSTTSSGPEKIPIPSLETTHHENSLGNEDTYGRAPMSSSTCLPEDHTFVSWRGDANQPLSPTDVLHALMQSDQNGSPTTPCGQMQSPSRGSGTTSSPRDGQDSDDHAYIQNLLFIDNSTTVRLPDNGGSYSPGAGSDVSSAISQNQRNIQVDTDKFPFKKFTVETMQKDLRAWIMDAGEYPAEETKAKLLSLIHHLITLHKPNHVRVFFRCFHRYCTYILREQQDLDTTQIVRPMHSGLPRSPDRLSWGDIFQDSEKFAQREFRKRYLHNFNWKD